MKRFMKHMICSAVALLAISVFSPAAHAMTPYPAVAGAGLLPIPEAAYVIESVANTADGIHVHVNETCEVLPAPKGIELLAMQKELPPITKPVPKPKPPFPIVSSCVYPRVPIKRPERLPFPSEMIQPDSIPELLPMPKEIRPTTTRVLGSTPPHPVHPGGVFPREMMLDRAERQKLMGEWTLVSIEGDTNAFQCGDVLCYYFYFAIGADGKERSSGYLTINRRQGRLLLVDSQNRAKPIRALYRVYRDSLTLCIGDNDYPKEFKGTIVTFERKRD
jgi:hypothetical protein